VLIEEYGGPRGGQLLNKINSIATKNPICDQSIERGCEILETVNYPLSMSASCDAKISPGLAFGLATDRGFVVGLFTHRSDLYGPLIWLSSAFYDEEPTVDDAARISNRRWCIFYPLGSALSQRLVWRIGNIPIPPELRDFPTMRSGNSRQGWHRREHGELRGVGLPGATPNLPIAMIANHEALKEFLVTDWRPECRW
jgi:hypothetical protein